MTRCARFLPDDESHDVGNNAPHPETELEVENGPFHQEPPPQVLELQVRRDPVRKDEGEQAPRPEKLP